MREPHAERARVMAAAEAIKANIRLHTGSLPWSDTDYCWESMAGDALEAASRPPMEGEGDGG